METITTEKEYVCKFCNKKFPSGKSLGGHIRIHTNHHSVHSSSYNAKKPKKMRLVEQKQQLCCRECGKCFDSLKDLWSHMDCYHCLGEKLVMDTETTSSGSTRKRSKKQSSSESFSNGSSSSSAACEIEEEHKNTALTLMMMSMDPRGLTLVVNSLVAEVSSVEQLKMVFSVKNQSLLKAEKAAVDDQSRSLAAAAAAAAAADDDSGAILSGSYSSDSDYFMNGPKNLDSDASVEELEAKEGRSMYELRKSKGFVLPCYETDSCAVDTNSKIDSKFLMVKKAVSANKNSKGHECPVCFRVFKSGQALGGHKRSHLLVNHEHSRIKHKAAAADMRIDLNLPAHDI